MLQTTLLESENLVGGGIVMFFAICFLLGAVALESGASSMKSRGIDGDDVLAAITMGTAVQPC